MAMHRVLFTGPAQNPPARTTSSLPLPAGVRKDVFLDALLEMPTTKHVRRSPLEWAGAAGFHFVMLAVLILVPLYTTGTIALSEYQDTPLIAPLLPPPPPPPAGAAPVNPHPATLHARLTFKLQKPIAPTSIPKKISYTDSTSAPPALSGVAGGVPGGVIGGQLGGVAGGVLRGTEPSAPLPPPPPARPVQKIPKIVRVGSNLKAPRQTLFVQPVYPPLARQARVSGTVVVDAIIDEQGNVVQARALSGPTLLLDAALRAVLHWKYEPTSLNGHPVSVELQVLVNFDPSETMQ